jgi:hypothetical protein
VTKISFTIINFLTHKAGAEHELNFYKLAREATAKNELLFNKLSPQGMNISCKYFTLKELSVQHFILTSL